jgi:hypothetical protein
MCKIAKGVGGKTEKGPVSGGDYNPISEAVTEGQNQDGGFGALRAPQPPGNQPLAQGRLLSRDPDADWN